MRFWYCQHRSYPIRIAESKSIPSETIPAAGAVTLALRKHVGRHPLTEYYRQQVIKGALPYEESLFESNAEFNQLRDEWLARSSAERAAAKATAQVPEPAETCRSCGWTGTMQKISYFERRCQQCGSQWRKTPERVMQ